MNRLLFLAFSILFRSIIEWNLLAQPSFPPATQAEVDAGILRTKFVSPATLRAFSGSITGASFSTLSVNTLNAGTLNVTNGFAAGSTFEVQYNSAGSFAASPNFRFLPSGFQLQVKNSTLSTELDINGEGFISQATGGSAELAFGIGARTNILIGYQGNTMIRPPPSIGTNLFQVEYTNKVPIMFVTSNGNLTLSNSLVYTASNTVDNGSYLLPARTNWVNDVFVKHAIHVGPGTNIDTIDISSLAADATLGIGYSALTPNIRGVLRHGGNGTGINNVGGFQIAAQGSGNADLGSGKIVFFTTPTATGNNSTDAAYVERMRVTHDGKVQVSAIFDPVTYGNLHVSFVGDSLVNQVVPTWPSYLGTYDSFFARSGSLTNYGVNGGRMTNLAAAYTTTIHLNRPTNTTDEGHLFIHGGGNDIFDAATAATVYSYITNICALGRADGYKVWVSTVTPRSSFTSTVTNAVAVTNLNRLILSDQTLYDGVLRADLILNDAANTNYLYDGTHPSINGATLLAQGWATLIHGQPWSIIATGETNSTIVGTDLQLNPRGRRVAIGTNLPQATFHVRSGEAANASIVRFDDTNGTARFQFGLYPTLPGISTLTLGNVVPNTLNYALADSAGFTLLNGSAGVQFSVGGTVRCSMDSSGNFFIRTSGSLGVGTTTISTGSSIDATGRVSSMSGTITNGLTLGLNGGVLTNTLYASTNIDFPSVAAGAVFDAAVSVPGASDGDVVTLGTVSTAIGPLSSGGYFTWASNAVVYIRFENNNLVSAKDPNSGTFKVKVDKFQ